MGDYINTVKQQAIKILKEKSEEHFINKTKGYKLFTLTNDNGIIVQITNFGCKIVSVYAPDRNAILKDIVLGYDTLKGYLDGNPYFGAVCGRFANRIAKGKLPVNGKIYQLPINNGPNSLHGGPEGFNSRVFDGVSIDGSTVKLSYLSRDGEMGYPGNLTVNITCSLTQNNELCLDFEATSDKATHVNICSHSYFNLAGDVNGDILNHEVMINAEMYTPVDELLIPTGEFSQVKETPMDFRSMTLVGLNIDSDFDQLKYGHGYDHNWVLNKQPGELSMAAVCYEPVSGRLMEVYTTQPGIQMYTGNWLDGSDIGKSNKVYGKRCGLCFETQDFPDAPNKPGFPSTLLRAGELYRQTCIYKFSVNQ